MVDWIERLRQLHDGAFAIDWRSHVDGLNRAYGIADASIFRTVARGLPPVLFNGDVEALRPGKWTLVVSINPGSNPLPELLYQERFSSPREFWDHWRTYNRDYVRTQSDFFPRLVDLARGVLNERESGVATMEYATTRMVFVEIWPYSSQGWPPKQKKGAEPRWGGRVEDKLFKDDPGVILEAQIADLLLSEAPPALVLVNGRPSVHHFERLHAQALRWRRLEYSSLSDSRKTPWHMEGRAQDVPALGFPQLRKARTHNSAREIQQLVDAGRRFYNAFDA